MLHISGMLEDCMFHATCTQHGKWQITICNGLTGYQQTHEWSDEQLGASLMLAIFDQGPKEDVVALAMETLYPFAIDAAKIFEVPIKHRGYGVKKHSLRMIP